MRGSRSHAILSMRVEVKVGVRFGVKVGVTVAVRARSIGVGDGDEVKYLINRLAEAVGEKEVWAREGRCSC